MLGIMQGNWIIYSLPVWMYMVPLIWKTVLFILIKMQSLYDSAILFLGYSHSEKWRHCLYKNLYTTVHSGFTHNDPKLKTVQTSSPREWVKQGVLSIYHALLPNNKKWINCWYTRQLRWISRELWWVKKANLKRLHIILFYLYNIFTNHLSQKAEKWLYDIFKMKKKY